MLIHIKSIKIDAKAILFDGITKNLQFRCIKEDKNDKMAGYYLFNEISPLRFITLRFGRNDRKLFLSEAFVVSGAFFLRDIFEHHVELVFRIVGELQ